MNPIKIFVVVAMLLGGVAVFCPSAPPEKTLPNLLEQAAGEQFHWDCKGERYSSFSTGLERHYKHKAQLYAIRAIGELGPEVKEAATPTLLTSLRGSFDTDTGDGLLPYQSEIVRTLAMIDAEEAIPVVTELLRTNALASGSPANLPRFGKKKLNWHDPKYDRWHTSDNKGPSGIIHSLMWYDSKHHPDIARQLSYVLVKLEADPQSSQWAKTAIAEGLGFFQGDKKAVQKGKMDMEMTTYRLQQGHFY